MNQSEKVHPRGQASAAVSLLLFPRRERTASPSTACGSRSLDPGGRSLTVDAAVRRFGADDEPPRGSGRHIPSAGELGRDSVTGRWTVSSGVRRWPRWTPAGRVVAAH